MKKFTSLLLAVLMTCGMIPFAAVTVAAGDYFGGLDERLDGPAAPSGLTPTAPTSKGGNDGTIGGVTTDMEYSIDHGENWIPVTESPITGLTPGKVLVRVAGTVTVKPSASAEVTVPDYSGAPGKANGPAAPDVTPVAPTRENGTDGKVTGVDETMEYSTDGGTTWKPVVGTSITGFIGGTNVTVRVKETDTTKAGASKMVVIPDFVKEDGKADGPAAPTGLGATAPTSKNGTDGKVFGANAAMEYSTDGGATWKPVTETVITGLSAGDVKVRVKETDSTKAGAIATVTVPDFSIGSVLSEGNFWIIIVVAVLALGGVAALVIVKKKKKPALAGGENTDEE